jgi:hypothetical protein
MGHPIPKQHPAVVLRAHYKAVRALLAAALVAIVALAVALVIIASDDKTASISPRSAESVQAQTLPQGTRFDGGPDEGTRGPNTGVLPQGTRFDGGPDEGTRGPKSYWEQSNPRTSYQPVPDQGFKHRAGGPSMLIGGARP